MDEGCEERESMRDHLEIPLCVMSMKFVTCFCWCVSLLIEGGGVLSALLFLSLK